MARQSNLVVGLDIGTTKICVIVGEMAEGGIDIVGIGTHPSKGLRKGVVVNIDSTVNSIQKALEEAELMAGCQITRVFAGIAGGHIKGFNSHGVIAIKDGEVTQQDIRRVIDAAKAVAIPMDREVIHVIPQEFIVDDQDGIMDPLGMSGVRLEAKVHIVTGAVTSAQNIIRSANRAGLDVLDIALQQLASSEATLASDEKELGVALVDIGGGTTDIAVFHGGSLKHTAVLAVGGNHITSDIAVGLRTPMVEAEKIKRRYGCALTSRIQKDETIEVPSVGGRKPRVLSRQVLGEIIEPRVQEIFELVQGELAEAGYDSLITSGVVLTGGAVIMDGMTELAEQVFNVPVRRGIPRGIGGLVDVVSSPMYATGVGLVMYGSRHPSTEGRFRVGDRNIFAKVVKVFKKWVEEFF
ncbi:MAG: cell division protein FtsA [Thermodesulfobacteriota bacterium]